MRRIHVADPGFLTTMQDLGRFGYAHLGVSPCGAADSLSLRAGNRLVGNSDKAAVLEMTMTGGTFLFEEEADFAVTGSDFGASLDNRPVSCWTAVHADAGSQLRLGRSRGGARCYLCVSGGFETVPILGSASTDLRSGFGGFNGRALRTGDRLAIGAATGRPRMSDARELRYCVSGATLRVTRGPQAGYFPAEALARLAGNLYVMRDDSNRLGIRLSGEPIHGSPQATFLTEGVSLGAVQIPPDGQPIILLVDQQTTGGYPKPFNVILADLPRAGQLAPRTAVRFVEVNLATAHAALHDQEGRLAAVLGEAE